MQILSLDWPNRENFLFYHYSLQNGIPNVVTVNKTMKKMLNELEIEPIITSEVLDKLVIVYY